MKRHLVIVFLTLVPIYSFSQIIGNKSPCNTGLYTYSVNFNEVRELILARDGELLTDEILYLNTCFWDVYSPDFFSPTILSSTNTTAEVQINYLNNFFLRASISFTRQGQFTSFDGSYIIEIPVEVTAPTSINLINAGHSGDSLSLVYDADRINFGGSSTYYTWNYPSAWQQLTAQDTGYALFHTNGEGGLVMAAVNNACGSGPSDSILLPAASGPCLDVQFNLSSAFFSPWSTTYAEGYCGDTIGYTLQAKTQLDSLLLPDSYGYFTVNPAVILPFSLFPGANLNWQVLSGTTNVISQANTMEFVLVLTSVGNSSFALDYSSGCYNGTIPFGSTCLSYTNPELSDGSSQIQGSDTLIYYGVAGVQKSIACSLDALAQSNVDSVRWSLPAYYSLESGQDSSTVTFIPNNQNGFIRLMVYYPCYTVEKIIQVFIGTNPCSADWTYFDRFEAGDLFHYSFSNRNNFNGENINEEKFRIAQCISVNTGAGGFYDFEIQDYTRQKDSLGNFTDDYLPLPKDTISGYSAFPDLSGVGGNDLNCYIISSIDTCWNDTSITRSGGYSVYNPNTGFTSYLENESLSVQKGRGQTYYSFWAHAPNQDYTRSLYCNLVYSKIGGEACGSEFTLSAENRKREVPRVVVFPNPGKGYFTLHSVNGSPDYFKSIRVYDYQGKVLRSIENTSLPLQFELNEAGLYFLEVSFQGSVNFLKLVVVE